MKRTKKIDLDACDVCGRPLDECDGADWFGITP